MKKPRTPFPTTGYFGPKYFCDREEEIKKMVQNLEGGQSTTLTSVRRMGKTALIHHLFNHLEKKMICVYVDILPTENVNEFLNQLATAIINSVEEKTGTGKKIMNIIKSLRPVFNFDSLTGLPNISFNFDSNQSRNHIESLLELLEKQREPVVVAIDEFQQIYQYPEKNIDAWLRKTIQQLRNVVFIFSGSQQPIMNDIFFNPEKPFYRSTDFLNIDKIESNVYKAFIIEKFNEEGYHISDSIVNSILKWANEHTYYVQLLCNRIFLSGQKNITDEVWQSAAYELLKEQEHILYTYRDMLTKNQWELLKAIATEGKVYKLTGKEFISKYKLGSSATVLRSFESLIKKELIYKQVDKNGNYYHCVYDVLFQRWIERA